MSKFKFIQQLSESPAPNTASLLPPNIKYHEYTVETFDKGDMVVYIPDACIGGFESALSEYNIIVHTDLKKVLREHRGIAKV